jgi:hypothetical protein
MLCPRTLSRESSGRSLRPGAARVKLVRSGRFAGVPGVIAGLPNRELPWQFHSKSPEFDAKVPRFWCQLAAAYACMVG